MPKTIAILQSFYIPWKGYFDIIHRADEFVLFDDMQYTKRFWINRNQIKTPEGRIWLTIPVKVKGRFRQAIKDTEISDRRWKERQWETIKRNYARAPYFNHYVDRFERLYLECEETIISRINYRFISAICDMLGIGTVIRWSMDYPIIAGKTERLVDICRQAGADIYLTGPSARNYLQEDLFREAGIQVTYMDYSGYPEYPQLFPPFIHEVSVIDLLFNTGPDAPRYMKSFVD